MATDVDVRRWERIQRLSERALAANGGTRSFARWKAGALEEVLDTVKRAARVDLLNVDFTGDFDLLYRVRMPVPRTPVGDQLVVGSAVMFHLVYCDEWRYEAPPGWLPLGIFEPVDIFHPNSRPSLRGALCLGDIAANTSPRELMLAGYYLGCLQDYTLDERDPHGVLNSAACEYFRCHSEYLPLTSAGLFDDWQPSEVK
jgi:hypothetical protein